MRHAANQEPGVQPRILKNPGNHAAGTGFSMRAGNSNHKFALEVIFPQPAGSGTVRDALVEHIFNSFISTGQSVAYDDQVRVWLQHFGAIAFTELDTLFYQLCTHGWVRVLIRSRNPVACLFGQYCEATHECAAGT